MTQSREEEFERQKVRLDEKMSRVKNKFIVMSGKGGVGKTSVAVNLAYALASAGHSVGILDIDIHGPNIAKMLGIEGASMDILGNSIIPIQALPNLKAVSMALLAQDSERPIIWRGPMKASAIRQFLSDVEWGDLDYLIIDSPPGTGDEPLSACQAISGPTGAIIVTTPQDVAVLDAKRSILFAQALNMPVVGVIENMSGFLCPHCGTESTIFKKGGGEKAAAALHVPFLGRVPFDMKLVELADDGTPFVHFGEGSASSSAFKQIVAEIEKFSSVPQ